MHKMETLGGICVFTLWGRSATYTELFSETPCIPFCYFFLQSSDPDVILCNNVQMIREKLVLDDNTIPESEYVYDLYYIDDEQVDFEMSEGATIGMHHADGDNELVYDFFPADTSATMFAEEDDDSNDEGNWRNDYPDEDPDKSNYHNL